MPTGYSSTFYVRTADRGLAVLTALKAHTKLYPAGEMAYINDVLARHSSLPMPPQKPPREDHILEPLETNPLY